MRKRERELYVLEHLNGSVWLLNTADGTPVCDVLALGYREVAGHNVPVTMHAGEQIGGLYVAYDKRVGLYELFGRYLRPRPVAR